MTKHSKDLFSRLKKEVQIKTSRSGGPGGQNVNKVETKVTISLNIQESRVLNDEEKNKIKARWENKISNEGNLLVSSDSKRSQLKNKELAFKKLYRIINKAFETRKKRKKTKPGKSAIEARLKDKKRHSEKKALRKNIL